MSNYSSPRDGNGVKELLLTRSDDGTFPMNPYIVPTTHHLLVEDGTSGSTAGLPNAIRDSNFHPVLMAVSSADFSTPVAVFGNFETGALLVKST